MLITAAITNATVHLAVVGHLHHEVVVEGIKAKGPLDPSINLRIPSTIMVHMPNSPTPVPATRPRRRLQVDTLRPIINGLRIMVILQPSIRNHMRRRPSPVRTTTLIMLPKPMRNPKLLFTSQQPTLSPLLLLLNSSTIIPITPLPRTAVSNSG